MTASAFYYVDAFEIVHGAHYDLWQFQNKAHSPADVVMTEQARIDTVKLMRKFFWSMPTAAIDDMLDQKHNMTYTHTSWKGPRTFVTIAHSQLENLEHSISMTRHMTGLT